MLCNEALFLKKKKNEEEKIVKDISSHFTCGASYLSQASFEQFISPTLAHS